MPAHDIGTASGPTSLTGELAAVADALRRITVRIRSRRLGDGAGVVWRSEGLIVTNAHVARAPRMQVELWDGRVLDAELTRCDPGRDLAALRVAASALPAATVGDVSALRPGSLVLALGHPLGVAHALALGVVHDPAGGRWLRADIRLAPGNSGGPLADAAGHVVGVNTLVAGGLGYAIPASAVERFVRGAGVRAA